MSFRLNEDAREFPQRPAKNLGTTFRLDPIRNVDKAIVRRRILQRSNVDVDGLTTRNEFFDQGAQRRADFRGRDGVLDGCHEG